MAYAALATSSVAVLVLSLHTIQALLMGGIFVMVRPPAAPGERLDRSPTSLGLRFARQGTGKRAAGTGGRPASPLHAHPISGCPIRAVPTPPAPQDPKYGPLSQQILTHEAFRAAGQRLKAAAGALGTAGKAGAVNLAALADFALQVGGLRGAGLNGTALALAWSELIKLPPLNFGFGVPNTPPHPGPPPPTPGLPLQFRRYRLAHAWHAHHEEGVIFK